jgi:hypothetical protein
MPQGCIVWLTAVGVLVACRDPSPIDSSVSRETGGEPTARRSCADTHVVARSHRDARLGSVVRVTVLATPDGGTGLGG